MLKGMKQSSDKELSLEEQVARIRRKRGRQGDYAKARLALNTLFLLLAAIGLAICFMDESYHVGGLAVIAAGMVLKVVEFVLRFL